LAQRSIQSPSILNNAGLLPGRCEGSWVYYRYAIKSNNCCRPCSENCTTIQMAPQTNRSGTCQITTFILNWEHQMKLMRLLERLQDFRFLPFFLLISMAVGISIGKLYSISNFTLTPPIDALLAIFHDTYTFSLANTLTLDVVIGLFLTMYPAITNIKFEDLGCALKSPRQLLVVRFFNFAIAPFWTLLANWFLEPGSDFHTGLVLYGLAPCIAMVIIFTFLSFGNTAMAIVLVR